MAMEHKAFIFDYNRFHSELRPVLERALQNGQTAELVDFIKINKQVLKDPYEGEALSEEIGNEIDMSNLDECGDYCLTKYYSPKDDLGLGYNWTSVQEALDATSPGFGRVVLGTALEINGKSFDPGKIGSYFVSPDEVVEGLKIIKEISGQLSEVDGMNELGELYLQAFSHGMGLYVTF